MSIFGRIPLETAKASHAPRVSFLSLPYDVRHMIYQQLFPPDTSVYIQVFDRELKAILPEDRLPIDLLATCKALHTEVGAFMYNKYLFSIIGTKQECLNSYEGFLQTMTKHAREEVKVNAFSNGAHSSTMGISLGVGNANMALLKRRQRGQPVEICHLKRELAMRAMRPSLQTMPVWLSLSLPIATSVAILAILTALMILGRP